MNTVTTSAPERPVFRIFVWKRGNRRAVETCRGGPFGPTTSRRQQRRPCFSLPLLAITLIALCPLPARAQFPAVQPIFNQQLGAFPPNQQANANAVARPARPGGVRGGGVGIGQVNLPTRWALRAGLFGDVCWPHPNPIYGWNSGFFPGYGYPWGFRSQVVVVQQPVAVPFPVVVPFAVPAAQPMAAVGQLNGAMPIGLPDPRQIMPVDNGEAGEAEIVRRVTALKPSNVDGRLRADKAIAEGDREFAAGRQRRAITKFRDAIRRAPDYSAGYFRAGHAHTAVGDYDQAVTNFAMALEIARTTHRDGFSLDTLYQDDQQSKQQHLADLSGALRQRPNEGGLHFLLGLTLHYDGNPLKAREHFRRAVELPGRHRAYAAMYLPAPPPAAIAAP
ncbi:MAG: tetratricopeptide repeat protein [Planctomycetaceae bacterium]|nr:MAG: tetratricopeptide repeat protein [Planctomycetaceae bacterium]